MIRLYLPILLWLFIADAAAAFQQFPEVAEKKLQEYYANLASEKVALIFNQPEYFPGDTAYFSTFVYPHNTRRGSTSNDVLNVFIVDKHGMPLVHNRTLLRENHGTSQFVIPRTTPSGVHRLIALKESNDPATSTRPLFESPFIVSDQKQAIPFTGDSIRFYTEGGTLITGLTSNLLITGVVPGDSVFLQDHKGSKITGTIATSSGFATLPITPETNVTYTLFSRNKSIPVTGIRPYGQNISIHSREGTTELIVRAHYESAPPHELYCIIHSRGRVLRIERLNPNQAGEFRAMISGDPFREGIYIASVVTTTGETLCERVFYVPGSSRDDFSVELTKKEAATRTSLVANLHLLKNSLEPTANAAITVYKDDTFGDHMDVKMNHLLQFADVRCPFVPLASSTPSERNALLISAKTRITWTDILNSTFPSPKESFPAYFKGTVVAPGKSIKDSTVVTCWLKKQDFVYEVYTKQDGRFQFPLFLPFEDDELIYTVTHKNDFLDGATVVLDSIAIPSFSQQPFDKSPRENDYFKYGSIRSAINKSYSYFEQKQRKTSAMSNIESIPADFTIDITRFKPFPTVIQMINEVIPLVKGKRVKDRTELRVFMKETAMHATRNPLIMIDGVLTDSIEHLLSLDPAVIKNFGVLNSRTKLVPYGALGKHGILVIETELGKDRPLKSRNSLLVKGIDKPVAFKSPDFSKSSKRNIPYLRPALYWNGKATLTRDEPQSIAFYTADDIGTYRISVMGFTPDGTFVEASATIQVVNQ